MDSHVSQAFASAPILRCLAGVLVVTANGYIPAVGCDNVNLVVHCLGAPLLCSWGVSSSVVCGLFAPTSPVWLVSSQFIVTRQGAFVDVCRSPGLASPFVVYTTRNIPLG